MKRDSCGLRTDKNSLDFDDAIYTPSEATATDPEPSKGASTGKGKKKRRHRSKRKPGAKEESTQAGQKAKVLVNMDTLADLKSKQDRRRLRRAVQKVKKQQKNKQQSINTPAG